MKNSISIFLSTSFFILIALATTGNAQEFNKTDANGQKQGLWKKMYSNGNTRYQGEFKNDTAIGLFKYYYNNGKLRATNNHVGNETVAHHAYHLNGKIKAKGLYRQMKKDSLWRFFNADKLLVLEENYAQNTLHGTQRKFYQNAQLGEETNFDMGEKNGRWVKFFENGKPWLEATYVDGNLDGAFKIFTPKGKTKTQGKYALGLRIGTWLMFNINGSVKTQDSYVNGVLKKKKLENGEFREYYENGIPKSIYNYKNGKKSGEFKEFYEMGEWVRQKVQGKLGGPDEIEEQLQGTQVRTKGWYYEGELNGKTHLYKPDGSVAKIEIWENGKLISTIDWESEGE